MSLDQAEAAYGDDDFATARVLYEKLAEEGQPQALYRLGYMYSNGEGVEADPQRAAAYYRRAAEAGHVVGAYCLAAMLAQGRGAPQDFGEALRWYRRAAEAGDEDAAFQIGGMYARGEGVEEDFGEARRWWLKAAEQGQSMAMFYLGHLYSQGDGVTADVDEAIEWYRRAADQGLTRAQQTAAELLARRSQSRADACEAVQRMVMFAQRAAPNDEFTLVGGDGAWVVKIGEQGTTIGMSGITLDQLTMSDEPLEIIPAEDGHDEATINPDADEFYQKACVAAEEECWEEAIELFTRSIELEPHPAAYEGRAQAWSSLGDCHRAIDDLNEALQYDYEPATYLTSRGWHWEQLGEFRRALDDYAQALKADVAFADAYNNRAWVLATCPDAELRDGKSAVEDALTACELSPEDDSGFFDTLAAAYAEAGDFPQAIQAAEKALELAEDDARAAMQQRLELYRAGKPFRVG